MIDEMFRHVIRRLHERGEHIFFLETGTDMAETVSIVSQWFAELDPEFGAVESFQSTGDRGYSLSANVIEYPVFTNIGSSVHKLVSVDVDPFSVSNARKLFEHNKNIMIAEGNSATFVDETIERREGDNVTWIFFLDAHWGKYWPLRDELTAIRRLEKFLVIIDDFFVPGRSNPSKAHGSYGFDFYLGKILDWGYVLPVLRGQPVKVFYPNESNRDDRGFVFISKGYDDKEISALTEGLNFFSLPPEDPAHREPNRASLALYLDIPFLLRTFLPLSWIRGAVRAVQRVRH